MYLSVLGLYFFLFFYRLLLCVEVYKHVELNKVRLRSTGNTKTILVFLFLQVRKLKKTYCKVEREALDSVQESDGTAFYAAV